MIIQPQALAGDVARVTGKIIDFSALYPLEQTVCKEILNMNKKTINILNEKLISLSLPFCRWLAY